MKNLFFALVLFCSACSAQSTFTVLPLGIKGGTDESNLSSYAVAITGTNEYVCLDAGTLHAGIQKALSLNTWGMDATSFLRKNVKGYLISHPHFDHVAGLLINAPEDSSKFIYGTESCLSVLQEKHFSWKSWANFGNEGERPTLNKYTYQKLKPGKETALRNTKLLVTPYILTHVSPNESTAFLIRSADSYILYLGDTGSDRIEKSDKLKVLWEAIAPLVRDRKLKAVFIEVSFSNEQPDSALFGHLTPKLLMDELNVLASFCGKNSLKDFPIVITHMKPLKDREERIKKQVAELNVLGVQLIFPEQGKLMKF